MILTFHPNLNFLGQLKPRKQEEIKHEPMLFSADMDFALSSGGPITREFVYRHLWDKEDWIIDSRVHMLMPGMYPCIPGWHHDDVPRTTESGQPNYIRPEYESLHRMAVMGPTAMTQFLQRPVSLKLPGDGIVYKQWDEEINAMFDTPDFLTAQSGMVYEFDWRTFHRGMPATDNGWRYFIRASRQTDRKAINEVRSQVQVYLPVVNQGW